MLYEQYTLDGHIDILDAHTDEVKARKLIFTCEKKCTLCGEEFMEGEEIEVTFSAGVDISSGKGKNGPWYPGAYSSRWIRHHASEIREMSRGEILFKSW